jgi:hypothetical protein
MAPDIEIHAPVTIYSPVSPDWSAWQPPTWATNAIVQPVTAPGYGIAPEAMNVRASKWQSMERIVFSRTETNTPRASCP